MPNSPAAPHVSRLTGGGQHDHRQRRRVAEARGSARPRSKPSISGMWRVEQDQRERLADIVAAFQRRQRRRRSRPRSLGRMPQRRSAPRRMRRLVALSSTTSTVRPRGPPFRPPDARTGLPAPSPNRAVNWKMLPPPTRSPPRCVRPSVRPADARWPGPARCRRSAASSSCRPE